MDDDADVIRVVEGPCGAIEHRIIEVPFRRAVLPDELVEVVPVFGVPERAALRRKVILVPPPQFSRWRQRLQVCLEVGDQITAHGDERLATFRPERRDDGGRPRSPIETGNDCLLDLESIHQGDDVESNGRLLSIPERFAREKARRAIAAQIRDDGPVARRCQRRSDIDVAVDVVGPTVQKNDRRTIPYWVPGVLALLGTRLPSAIRGAIRRTSLESNSVATRRVLLRKQRRSLVPVRITKPESIAWTGSADAAARRERRR